jgi:hypothetical protein
VDCGQTVIYGFCGDCTGEVTQCHGEGHHHE